MLWRNTVPALGLSEMEIVDTVQIHVFCVPGKSAFPHSKVQVCSIHSLNADPVIFIDIIQDRSKFVDVPRCKSC